jgi:glycosyltransferase involved in cell wall biosynthesis
MSLDVVIPAHDEEDRIDSTLRAYERGLPEPDVRFRIALDGCRDGTADVVREHAMADRRVDLLEFAKLGKGGVLMEAFRRCDADLIAFVDADGATPPSELARLVEVVVSGGADIAIASRRHPASVTPGDRPLGRRLTSAGFAFGVRRLFDLPFSDTQCGAKVLRRSTAERIVPLLSSRDFLFDVDLLVVGRTLGYEIVEVPTVWIDKAGSKLRAGADARRMAASALRLWIHHRVLPLDASAEHDAA